MKATPPFASPADLSTGIRYFLPLMHIAWSDEVLTPTEINMIEEKVRKLDWLEPEDKQYICARLDPSQPPSQQELKSWLRYIRNSAQEIPSAVRHNLVDLAIQLANLGTEHQPGHFKNEAARKSLLQIEAALGVVNDETLREMLVEARERSERIPDDTPGFDPRELEIWLDGEQAAWKKKVLLLLSDPLFAFTDPDRAKGPYREQVLEWLQYLADQGLGALSYPVSAGGADNMAAYVTVFETLGYHDLSLLVKFGVQFGLFGGSIVGLGTAYHHEKYLPSVGSLALPGCFAMTEAAHGSNVRDLETTATYVVDSQEFIIHTPHYLAHKEYIGNAAAHGRMATVFAQLKIDGDSYGVHAFLVPIRDDSGQAMPGVRIEDSGQKLGLNGVDNGRLWFDQVRIPRENLLNRFAEVSENGMYSSPITSESRRFFTMLGTLVGGRICVPMAGLSAAKTGLAIAIKYACKRRQFGPAGKPERPIMDYPTHQRRLLPKLAKTYALHVAHHWMAKRFVNLEEEDQREIEALAAGLKAVSTWHTTETLQECREACGGMGYLSVNRFADLKADTDIFTTFEGDNTVLMQLVAKGRLTEFKHEFASMNFFGMLNYVAGQAATVITEKNPIIIRNTGEAHLRDPEFLLSAFRHREDSLVMSAARRMKHRLDKGMDSFEAMLEVQTHFVALAHAYIERVILEQSLLALEKVEEKNSFRSVLQKLVSLYALSYLETHQAWYLKHGFFSADKANAVRKQIDALCLELRPEALGLVSAFGIPAPLLAAPIALHYPADL